MLDPRHLPPKGALSGLFCCRLAHISTISMHVASLATASRANQDPLVLLAASRAQTLRIAKKGWKPLNAASSHPFFAAHIRTVAKLHADMLPEFPIGCTAQSVLANQKLLVLILCIRTQATVSACDPAPWGTMSQGASFAHFQRSAGADIYQSDIQLFWFIPPSR